MQKYTAGGVQIVECYKGSTAEEAGVKVDDVITAINGEDITDTELQDVVSMIKDNEDKDVVLTVQRKGEDLSLIHILYCRTSYRIFHVRRFYRWMDGYYSYDLPVWTRHMVVSG